MKKWPISLFLAAMLLASACTPTVLTRGNLISATQYGQIEANKSTRADVVQKWGPPTTTSPFDPNTWYYIGETDSQKGIYAAQVDKRRLIRLKFDPKNNDTVVEVTDLDPKAGRDVAIVDRKTPSAGKDPNAFQQFIGNIGKYNPAVPTDKK